MCDSYILMNIYVLCLVHCSFVTFQTHPHHHVYMYTLYTIINILFLCRSVLFKMFCVLNSAQLHYAIVVFSCLFCDFLYNTSKRSKEKKTVG